MFSMQSVSENPLIATFQLSSAASLNLGQSQNGVSAFSPFPTMFSTLSKTNSKVPPFQSHLNSCQELLSIWTSLHFCMLVKCIAIFARMPKCFFKEGKKHWETCNTGNRFTYKRQLQMRFICVSLFIPYTTLSMLVKSCLSIFFYYIPSSEILEFNSVINFDIITSDDINFHFHFLR